MAIVAAHERNPKDQLCKPDRAGLEPKTSPHSKKKNGSPVNIFFQGPCRVKGGCPQGNMLVVVGQDKSEKESPLSLLCPARGIFWEGG